MKPKLLIGLFVPLLLAGCGRTASTPSGGEIVTVSPDRTEVVRWDDFVTGIEFVAPETSDSSLLNQFVDLRLAGERMYVSCKGMILAYDRSGRLLSTFRRQGRGPGEYAAISDFRIEENGDMLLLDPMNRRLLRYDAAGNCLGSVRTEYAPRSFALLDDTTLVAVAGYFEPGDLFHFHDRRDLAHRSSRMPQSRRKGEYCHFARQHGFFRHRGRLLYTEAASCSILELTADSVAEHYRLTSDHFPPDDFFEGSYNDVRYFMQQLEKYAYAIPGGTGAAGDRYLLLSFSGSTRARYCFYDTATHACHGFREIGLDDAVRISRFTIVSAGGDRIALVIPADELSGKCVGGRSFSDLREDDNPVVCLGRLR